MTTITWKRKWFFIIWATNSIYIGILENGMFVPMKIIPETVENSVWVSQRSTPKEASKFTDIDKEYVTLDHGLRLIIVEKMDKTMSHLALSCQNAKLVCDSVKHLMEGTDKVRENKYYWLISRYEVFKSLFSDSVHKSMKGSCCCWTKMIVHGKKYP